jgi:heat-inducible transcriptional repressor
MEPSERSGRILAALVREYIASGAPVSSSMLSAAGQGVSSATVRSILSRLEEEGFVQQPHTSAGRIPTDLGYRFYVDLLLDSKRPTRAAASAVEARLRRGSAASLADSVLSQASPWCRVRRGRGVRAPAHTQDGGVRPRRVHPLTAARLLVVIVARGGHVLQKVIDLGVASGRRPPSSSQLLNSVHGASAAPRGRPSARSLHEEGCCTTR